MLTRRVINIVNVLRRSPDASYCERTVELVQARLPATWLLSYDAIVSGAFTQLFLWETEIRAKHELGLWLEVTQQLCDAAKSRSTNPLASLTIAYTPEQRMKLVDVAIDRFVGLLGYAPRSVAAPYIDALTLDYLHSKYKISASANFMDQCGTHNRTIWGAPYAGAYFPSKQNALIPASTPEQQIGVPIFRMRGPDPIHQYDLDLGEPAQDALTFEPLENNGGSSPEWMGVYLDMLAKAPALALSYSQAGFRSHFQWDEVKDGMALQIQEFVKRREAGELEFECLGDTGAWFQKSFSATPPQATVALLDTLGGDRRSIWYHSKFYRANLLLQADAIRIRDLHLFDENYPERYLNSECRENTAVIDTLPVLDGYRWSNKDHRAWGTPMLMKNGVVDHPLRAADNPIVREHGSVLEVEFPLAADDGILRIVFDEKAMRWILKPTVPEKTLALEFRYAPEAETGLVTVEADGIGFKRNGFEYAMPIFDGSAVASRKGFMLRADQHRIAFGSF